VLARIGSAVLKTSCAKKSGEVLMLLYW